jgi:hypothetical protein
MFGHVLVGYLYPIKPVGGAEDDRAAPTLSVNLLHGTVSQSS